MIGSSEVQPIDILRSRGCRTRDSSSSADDTSKTTEAAPSQPMPAEASRRLSVDGGSSRYPTALKEVPLDSPLLKERERQAQLSSHDAELSAQTNQQPVERRGEGARRRGSKSEPRAGRIFLETLFLLAGCTRLVLAFLRFLSLTFFSCVARP